jgi:hypothetical protein
MFGKKLIKRCPKGHEMELHWRRCPRCTRRAPTALPARDITEQTVVVQAEAEAGDHTRVVEPSSPAMAGAVTVVARLEAASGPLAGQEFRVLQGRTKLGKSPREEGDAMLLPLADPYLSKDHLALEAGPGGVVLVDLGSTNGTFVNGQRVERAVLRDGDELRVGGSVLRLRLGRP